MSDATAKSAKLAVPVGLGVSPDDHKVCADLADRSLFGLLENEYGLKISTGRRTFTATVASGRVATALGVPDGFPLLYLEQITYLDDGRPIEYSDVWIHSDRMRVTSLLSRR
ncbi:UTRA domain-containing protein [Micromonospora sp. CPCC 206060]|uniref:GntR family transcriptional regulator n=1 Tax=Micromonospora sp. CPCC 206060 TaxID=3122406 RepID=UPI002FF2D274